MRIIERIKNLFKRGGYALTGQTITSLNDHPKINIDPNELARIERNFNDYKGNHPKVEYINSMGKKQERDYMHLNLTKLTAKYLSGLVFNEQCEVVVSDADEKKKKPNTYESANDFIQHVFEHNDFKKNLMRYLEPMFATGGLAVRPYIDQTTNELEFSWALADAFYPLKSNSRGISEGVMMSVTTKVEGDRTIYYTLLEFHEWESTDVYKITNELYRSEESNVIGKRVPLSDQYEDLQKESRISGLTRPLFNYLSPSGFNNISPLSPLGLGLTDNSKSTLKKINDTYDGFYWEVKMGQRTVFVDDMMLNTLPSEDGKPPVQVFDPDVNVYKSMRMRDATKPIHDVTNDIRTEQYTSAINHALKELEMQLELSVGTFSFDGRSMKTATEITSENSDTYRTRNTHVNEVEKFIKGLVVSSLELASSKVINEKTGDVYSGIFDGEIPTFEHIGVDFDDGIFVDKKQQLQFYGQAKQFGFIPTAKAIERVFQLPEDVAEQWAEQVLQEQIEVDPMLIQQQSEEDLYGVEE